MRYEERLVYEALKEVLYTASTEPESLINEGICENVFALIDVKMDHRILTSFFINWSKSAGCKLYPIPITDPSISSRQRQFECCYFNHGFWKSEQLKLRIELMEFVIAEMEKEQ